MKIRKGTIVRVSDTEYTPVRYHGRTGVVLKKSRNGVCEVKFPEAHRITPMLLSEAQLEVK